MVYFVAFTTILTQIAPCIATHANYITPYLERYKSLSRLANTPYIPHPKSHISYPIPHPESHISYLTSQIPLT